MVEVEQVLFRRDIIKYLTVDYSVDDLTYIIVDCYFTYVIVDCYFTHVIAVWLDPNIWHWPVEASSHHSDDGRKPETSCDSN